MNKEKIVQELDKYVKSIDKVFEVNAVNGDLNIDFNQDCIAYFNEFNFEKFIVSYLYYDSSAYIVNSGIIKKFYDKAVELLKKNIVLYTVQVIKTDKGSFLNYDCNIASYIISDTIKADGYKVAFTQSEIEELKQRDDIAIDWDKAIIKEVK